MADKKISQLSGASTPLAGTEVLPIVQSGSTVKVSAADITAGRAVSALTYTSTVAIGTAPLTVTSTTEVANLRAANATSADTANAVKSNATTGVLQVAGPAAAATRVMTVPDANFTAARTDAAQSFTGAQTFASTISVGNATPSASGAGVTFPATQSASTNANTLDDYEEGSWTVGIAFGGASTGITYSNTTDQSKYVRIGRQVTCVGYVALTSKGSSTGTATITGLPFTVAADEPNYGGIAIGYFSNITFADFIMGRTVAGATSIALAEVTNAGVDSNITNADFANDSFMRFTLTYFI